MTTTGTLEDCYTDTLSVSVATICIEPSEHQGDLVTDMPTAVEWCKDNWFVFLAMGLIIGLSLIGILFSVIRWCRRIQHRHLREARDKRVDGIFRIVSASFRGSLSRKASVANLDGQSGGGGGGALFGDDGLEEENADSQRSGSEGPLRRHGLSRRGSFRNSSSETDSDYDDIDDDNGYHSNHSSHGDGFGASVRGSCGGRGDVETRKKVVRGDSRASLTAPPPEKPKSSVKSFFGQPETSAKRRRPKKK